MKNFRNIICTLLAIISFSVILTGCGNSLEKKIIGEWLMHNTEDNTLEFYEDGTCKILSEYGTGTYTIDSNNQLKITDYYGSSETYKYVELEKIDDFDDDCWCIDGDNLYINSSDNYYVKQ